MTTGTRSFSTKTAYASEDGMTFFQGRTFDKSWSGGDRLPGEYKYVVLKHPRTGRSERS